MELFLNREPEARNIVVKNGCRNTEFRFFMNLAGKRQRFRFVNRYKPVFAGIGLPDKMCVMHFDDLKIKIIAVVVHEIP